MLDIKRIKENPDAVKAGLKAKEVDCDAIVDKILELDVQIRALKTSTEGKPLRRTSWLRKTASCSVRRRAPRSRVRTPPSWMPRSRPTRLSPSLWTLPSLTRLHS